MSAVAGWPGSQRFWGKVVVEAQNLADRVLSNPIVWISTALGRWADPRKKEKAAESASDDARRRAYKPMEKDDE
jgi:hypothetical protein